MRAISSLVREARSLSDQAEPPSQAEAGNPQKWAAPAIDDTPGQGYPTAGRLQDLQKQAYDEAWNAGHAEGLKAGGAEVRRRAARLDELLRALARPFDAIDETVEKQLVELAMTVVKQLFRRELQIDPGHVVGVVREALQVLPATSKNINVHMHPEDALLVEKLLSPSEGDGAWTIVEDPLVNRGGCKVITANSRVDAQAETRLRKVIEAISNDERQ